MKLKMVEAVRSKYLNTTCKTHGNGVKKGSLSRTETAARASRIADFRTAEER
jgi:hypothetical protein